MEMIRNSFKLGNARIYENHLEPFFYLKMLEQTGNWRPISSTSVVYRTLIARMTKCLFDAHQKILLVSLNQKRFIPGIACCTEHAGKANSIITNANRNGRILCKVVLDLKDAFRSIPHQIIKKNMIDIGIPD
jgi:hypothetical protein